MDIAAINQQLAADPVYQQILHTTAGQYGTGFAGGAGRLRAIAAYLKSKGIQIPEGYAPSGHTGQLVKSVTAWDQFKPWAIGAGILLTAGALTPAAGAVTPSVVAPSAGAGAGAGAGGAAGAAGSAGVAGGVLPATQTVPFVGGTLPAGLPSGLGMGGVTSASNVASAGPWSSLISGIEKHPTLISAGLGLLGTAISSHQTSKATEAQLQATREALALQKQMYEQTRADTGPYRALGGGSANTLSYLLGTSGHPEGVQPFTDTTIAPMGTAAPRSPMPTPQQPVAQPAMVQMRSPNGQVGMVPAERVQDALQAGGTRIS